MALSDLFANSHLLIRWLHVMAGITWIGLLYFLNFINVPLQGAMDDSVKKAVNSQLLPRVLWWFRWGAMITFVAGWTLFVMSYMYAPGVGFGPTNLFLDDEGITGRAVWILTGMLFASVMWFNVWFIIWPAQKRMLSGRASNGEVPRLRRIAGVASRMNTFLSGPMLFGMLAPAHYGAINTLTWVAFTILGLAVIFWTIRSSYSVGASV